MKLAIMQPYFMPYIGYWQLLQAVDKFVIYDNIQFSKKGWFHRNRILANNTDKIFTLPLKKDSDYLNVNERFLGGDYVKQNEKTLRIIKNSYSKTPYFKEVYPIIENIFRYEDSNLFNFTFNSIKEINKYLNINTDIIISSNVGIDHNGLNGQDKVLAIVKELNAKEYINTIGGVDLYEKQIFENNNVELHFLKSNTIEYQQLNNNFIPWLSIIDVMMFNNTDEINNYLNRIELT